MWVSNCQRKESCLHIFYRGNFETFCRPSTKIFITDPNTTHEKAPLLVITFCEISSIICLNVIFFMLILNGRLCCTNENFLLEFVISKQLSTNQTHNVVNIYLKPNHNRNIKNPNICPTWFCKVFIKFMSMLMKNTECFWFLGCTYPSWTRSIWKGCLFAYVGIKVYLQTSVLQTDCKPK